jgi:hypothetical protein
MPYIDEKRRQNIRDGDPPRTAGELNFAITNLCEGYREQDGDFYSTFNEIMGALECAKHEFYCRVVMKYEKAKRKDNGDVYAPVTP